METAYAFIIGFFLLFPEPRVGVFVRPELTDYEQRCHAGCLLNFQGDGRVDYLQECDTECEGYDGEAG